MCLIVFPFPSQPSSSAIKFLPVNRVLFFVLVAIVLPLRGVQALGSVKCLEIIWLFWPYVNKIELNWIEFTSPLVWIKFLLWIFWKSSLTMIEALKALFSPEVIGTYAKVLPGWLKPCEGHLFFFLLWLRGIQNCVIPERAVHVDS